MSGQRFKVHCAECGETWTLAFLPLPVDAFARLASRAACPRGCEAQILCGPAASADLKAARSRGGRARAEAMTAERRIEVARDAANKRWHGPTRPAETGNKTG